MRELPLPSDENGDVFDAGEVFETCVAMVRSNALRENLLAIRPKVEAETNDYAAKAIGKCLYKKVPHNDVGAVPGEVVVKVYTKRMVPRKSKGRRIYDQILAAPSFGRCPFCGIGTVNTLDHYLPKSQFPVFSVAPSNLVPACQWCQKEKGDYYAVEEGQQLLHPYYDDVDADVWLAAEVVAGTPAGFRYFVLVPDAWPEVLDERLNAHLRELNLLTLFAANAGGRLAEIRFRLTSLYGAGGRDAVCDHLSEELDSFENDHLNSWLAAMYRAAIASDWFCDGGFMVE